MVRPNPITPVLLISFIGAVLIAGLIPHLVSNFVTYQFTLAIAWGVAMLGLNVLTGYNGQFSVGHSAFFRALLLPEPVRFTNCAVWRATLTATGEPAWRGAVELFPGWESFSEEDAAESTARETAAQSAPP